MTNMIALRNDHRRRRHRGGRRAPENDLNKIMINVYHHLGERGDTLGGDLYSNASLWSNKINKMYLFFFSNNSYHIIALNT